MAGSLNRATLIGHLGKDPEVRRTASSQQVVNFRVATSESWRDKSTGERKEQTEWHSVVIFNENLAKVAEQYLRKGARVLVEGAIKTRKWQDQSGQDRYSTEIVVSNFGGQLILLDKAERQQAGPEVYGTTRTRPETSTRPSAPQRDEMDDEIPF